MDIVIISHFEGDFSKSDNDRFFYLANMLKDDDEVELITSGFFHTTKKQREERRTDLPFQLTFLEEPGYPKNVCVKRFYSHYVWGKRVKKYLKERKRKPDVVYCAIPSLTAAYFAAKYCEENQVRFVIDVQDLWPEAFQMVFNVPVISPIVFFPFKALANGIYKRADQICAVSDTYCDRARQVNKKCGQTHTVFLGTELSVFDRYSSGKAMMEKKDDEIWLAYCGTLGSSYDLTCVFDALVLLHDPKVRLIVMGDGPKQAEFQAYVKDKDVNVTFMGRLQYDQMCSLLVRCDVTINPIAHMAAQSIINKHADYAASGLPVISTQENEEYRSLVNEYQMGFNCSNGDASELADKISLLVKQEDLRKSMGRNARKCAMERFDRAYTYQTLVSVIRGN